MRRARVVRQAIWPGVVLATVLAFAAPGVARAQQGPAAGGSSCWHLGENVVVAGGETLSCNLVVVGGDVTVEAEAVVDGDVAVPFGRAAIDGEVAGDAFASGGLRLGSGALIRGDASSLGDLEMVDGARVAGRVDRLAGQPRAAAAGLDVAELASGLAALMVLALLAAITAALAMYVAGDVVEVSARAGLGSARRVLASLVVGAIVGVAGAFLAVVALLTVFLPLVVGALLVVAAAIGSAALALRVGDRLLPSARPSARAALGAAVLIVLAFAPIVSGRLGLFVLGLAIDLAALALVLGAGVLGAVEALRHRADRDAWPSPAPGRPRTTAATAAGAAPSPPSMAATAADPLRTVGLEGAPSWPEPGAEAEPASGAPRGEPALEQEAAAGPAFGAPEADLVGVPADASSPPALSIVEPGIEPPHGPGREAAPGAEALADPESAAVPEPSAPEAPPGGGVAEASAPTTMRDLEGMTPIYAHLLASAGIAALDDLASASAEAVVRALSVPGVRPIGVARAEAWIAAARLRREGTA